MPETHDEIIDAIAEYLQLRKVPYRVDGAGIHMTRAQRRRFYKQNGKRGWPDITVARAKGPFHGLFIEVKKYRDEVYRKDGTLRETKHIQEQANRILSLRKEGYFADFGFGTNGCKRIIDEYLSMRGAQNGG